MLCSRTSIWQRCLLWLALWSLILNVNKAELKATAANINCICLHFVRRSCNHKIIILSAARQQLGNGCWLTGTALMGRDQFWHYSRHLTTKAEKYVNEGDHREQEEDLFSLITNFCCIFVGNKLIRKWNAYVKMNRVVLWHSHMLLTLWVNQLLTFQRDNLTFWKLVYSISDSYGKW